MHRQTTMQIIRRGEIEMLRRKEMGQSQEVWFFANSVIGLLTGVRGQGR
jgi:hypothetical protein